MAGRLGNGQWAVGSGSGREEGGRGEERKFNMEGAEVTYLGAFWPHNHLPSKTRVRGWGSHGGLPSVFPVAVGWGRAKLLLEREHGLVEALLFQLAHVE